MIRRLARLQPALVIKTNLLILWSRRFTPSRAGLLFIGIPLLLTRAIPLPNQDTIGPQATLTSQQFLALEKATHTEIFLPK